MVVNCVLPFFHALAVYKGDETLERLCLTIYRGLPRLQENEITREMWQQLSYPLALTVGSKTRKTHREGDSGWERWTQTVTVDDRCSPADPRGRLDMLWREVCATPGGNKVCFTSTS